MDAPWPYLDEEESDELSSEPSWECPGGECACHPVAALGKTEPHTIVLYDEKAARMPSARCRVFTNGRLCNKDRPYANPAGEIVVDLVPGTKRLRVEWAPPSTPNDPLYPFRSHYYVEPPPAEDEATHRRLANLGFATSSDLADNVEHFQRRYRRTPTREWQDIKEDVRRYHDFGMLPPFPPSGDPAPAERDFQLAKLAPDDKGPSPAAPTGKTQLGGARVPNADLLIIELRIATPLSLVGKRLTHVVGATLTLDTSAATPASSAGPFTSKDKGIAEVTVPAVTGSITIKVAPPKAWLSPTQQPAEPRLTQAIASIGDSDLTSISTRASLHSGDFQ